MPSAAEPTTSTTLPASSAPLPLTARELVWGRLALSWPAFLPASSCLSETRSKRGARGGAGGRSAYRRTYRWREGSGRFVFVIICCRVLHTLHKIARRPPQSLRRVGGGGAHQTACQIACRGARWTNVWFCQFFFNMVRRTHRPSRRNLCGKTNVCPHVSVCSGGIATRKRKVSGAARCTGWMATCGTVRCRAQCRRRR